MEVGEVLPASNAGYMNPGNLDVKPQNSEYMHISSIRPNQPEVLTEIKPETIESHTGGIASTRVG